MLSNSFSEDVIAGGAAFISKPVRDLYADEQAYIERRVAEVSLDDDAAWQAYFQPQTVTASHERASYKKHLYAEGKTKVVAPRRYYAQEAILSWCIFKAIDSFFTEAEDIHNLAMSTIENPDLTATPDTSYEAYLTYLKRSLNWATVLKVTWVMAFTLKPATEIRDMIKLGKIDEWVETCKTWYANSFLLTPWFGKSKEAWVIPYLKEEVAKYEGLHLMKTSSSNDRLYMIDFMIAEKGYTYTLGEAKRVTTPILGISVKGLSWLHSNNRGTSTYQSEGEKREKAGHARLKKDHGVDAEVLVSGFQQKNAELTLVGDIRRILITLEKAGKITRTR